MVASRQSGDGVRTQTRRTADAQRNTQRGRPHRAVGRTLERWEQCQPCELRGVVKM